MASSPKSPFGSSSPFNPETNPFLASAREADGPTGYAMIPSGPALDASQVESSELATEVLVRWDDTILHVGHLGAGKSFSVGEGAECDLTIPAERLGSDRLPIVVAEGASSVAVIPAGAEATIEIGGKKLDIAGATAEGIASASAYATGATAVKLSQGMRISMRASGFVFEVASVFAGKRVAGKTSGDKKSFAAQALSFGVHGAILAAMFAFMPALAATDDAELSEDQAHLLSAALKAQAEKDLREEEQKAKEDGEKSTQGSDTGMASPGEPGKMGNVKAPQANRHYAVAGNEKERALSRQAALEDAQNFGFAGMLASLQQDDPNAPTNPWSNGSIGMDAMTANGNLWGALPGESFGYGGLALSGGGEGAGGLGQGMGDVAPGVGHRLKGLAAGVAQGRHRMAGEGGHPRVVGGPGGGASAGEHGGLDQHGPADGGGEEFADPALAHAARDLQARDPFGQVGLALSAALLLALGHDDLRWLIAPAQRD